MNETTDAGTPALPEAGGSYDPIEDRLRQAVRSTIEALFEEELAAFIGRCRYGRGEGAQKGYRHGHRERQLTGTFGTETVSVPRARIEDEAGKITEWRSKALPRYQRLTRKAEALIAAVYLAGTNTRRVKRALVGLFGGAVSKDVVSRAWRKVKVDWDAWCARSLAGEDIVRLILDGTVIKTRLDRKATEAVNALRSHLYEFGHVAPEGIGYVPRLERVIADPDADIPDLARDICRMLLEQITHLIDRINALKARIAAMSNEAEMPRQLQTMPGVGPITALAVETFAPPMDQFRRGRDFAAWLGLVPRQHSTGGKQRLGKTSKMGQRDIRRLLVIGATAVIRWASRRGAPKGSWLARMLERKPVPVVAVALANKMARGIWAMLTRGESYRGPVLIGA